MNLRMDDIEQWKAKLLEFFEQGTSTMQDVVIQIQQKIKETPDVQLYSASAVLVLTILLSLLLRLFKHKKSNTIVLTGLIESGKTVLFQQLRDGSAHQGTVTSMQPNEDTFVLHSETAKNGKFKPVHVVDVPGHSRFRTKLDDYLPQAAGVIFVIDALEFLPNCRAAAEFLYDILTKGSIVKKKVPLLIVCNKTEKVTAHSQDFIRKQLEKEIEKLRTSRTVITQADITSEYTLGEPGKPFSFPQCQNKVTLAEASGLTGDISQVEAFIREHVKP